MGFEHGADGIDRDVKPSCDFAICGLELARIRRRRVEIGGQPRAVAAQSLQLRDQRGFATIGLAPALDRRIECVERRLGRRLQRADFGDCALTRLPARSDRLNERMFGVDWRAKWAALEPALGNPRPYEDDLFAVVDAVFGPVVPDSIGLIPQGNGT